ncbi:TetR/AcrR family transcriptional regulator [Nocardia cyriacigeorgica]|uniref:HTH-type transcriptional repressor AcnR n=1 Tax=Nocardia cyriacigeorgica TaxID=135487 RepID=A0A4U8W8L6_9NOCA|nr:TetR/AcrR family transcriptional regulator [Nocardia cyriacigeorgica]MBF6090444.1 TetR/AcrR family transcriptional regulator [Nocardia cyriacigeorgica]MBF6096285.1 TetR/AcrR family transcriptional regulator [Nocardia cyriacigeorgica]MBF6101293.1 TetR/AcrR family transcriptional regulator [Nocardia cyriacigeorgica]MBF6162193.1 TetR/AcrR family transcriptional regulator [Nocardia cyriacigeorgica]MBF6201152.1 TetR/AcrR family transcriptional regulator [Nocardia cyriacigeorgica]
MARTALTKPARRTQEQRSSEMRVRLLDATIDCLVEYGYAGTTTPRVAERAGVTRGAQVHHFGSKNDLVVAAISHLAQRRAETAMRDMGRVENVDDPVDAALEFLWELHQGPLFIATVELWVAGRTDPVLAAAMEKVEPFVNNAVLLAVARFVPDEVRRKDARDFVYTAMDALRGILISNFIDPDPDRARRRWGRACAHLRTIAATALTPAVSSE